MDAKIGKKLIAMIVWGKEYKVERSEKKQAWQTSESRIMMFLWGQRLGVIQQ